MEYQPWLTTTRDCPTAAKWTSFCADFVMTLGSPLNSLVQACESNRQGAHLCYTYVRVYVYCTYLQATPTASTPRIEPSLGRQLERPPGYQSKTARIHGHAVFLFCPFLPVFPRYHAPLLLLFDDSSGLSLPEFKQGLNRHPQSAAKRRSTGPSAQRNLLSNKNKAYCSGFERSHPMNRREAACAITGCLHATRRLETSWYHSMRLTYEACTLGR